MARKFRGYELAIAAHIAMLASGHAVGAEGSHPCAAIEDSTARLNCYDAVFGRPSKQGSETSKPATEASAATPPVNSDPKQDFGFSAEQVATVAKIEKKAPEQPESISAAISALAKKPTGEFIATLDNGQVWVQRETNTQVRVSVNDKVTIRKGTLGSYFLVTQQGLITRVRRFK